MAGGWSLGVDVGTTTISVAAWDPGERRVLGTYTVAHGAGGGGEQDPAVIRAATWRAMAEVGHQAGGPAAAVACTGQMHGVLLLDTAGNPVGPLVTWQDARTAGRAALANDALDRWRPGGWRARGCRLQPGYGALTLAMLREEGRTAGAVRACTVADWIAALLCGVVATDPSQAASWGILDLARRSWDLEAAERIGVPVGLLPSLREPGTVLGQTDLGELGRDVAVVTGLGDNQASVHAALAGSGGVSGCVVNVGTGSQLSRVLAAPSGRELAVGLEERPYLDGATLLVGASLSGGSSYALLADFLRASGAAPALSDAEALFQAMDTWAAAVSPGCDGLVCDPAFRGERGEPGRRGSFRGVGPDNFSPGHLCRALLEGLAACLADLADRAGCTGLPVVASGNMVRRSALFREIVSAKLGAPLILSPFQEEAAVGAALVAARAL